MRSDEHAQDVRLGREGKSGRIARPALDLQPGCCSHVAWPPGAFGFGLSLPSAWRLHFLVFKPTLASVRGGFLIGVTPLQGAAPVTVLQCSTLHFTLHFTLALTAATPLYFTLYFTLEIA